MSRSATRTRRASQTKMARKSLTHRRRPPAGPLPLIVSDASLNQTAAQEVERGLGCAPAYEVAVAGEHDAAVFGVRVVGEGDVDEADGLLLSPAAGACDARDGESEVRRGAPL